jgi:hypothetical protein
VDVTADASGNITDTFQLPSTFAALYNVTATGDQSGTVITKFTDSNNRFLSSGPTLSNVSWQKYSNSNCTTAIAGAGNSGTGNITSDPNTTLSVPAGNNQFVGLTVPATANSKNFQNWARTSNNNAFTVSGTGNRTICTAGDSTNGTAEFTATYLGTPDVTIDSVSPNPIGASGNVTVTWHADENGTFSVRVGGTDCSSGTQVSSGNYSSLTNQNTQNNVSTSINATSLTNNNGDNTIRVCVTNAINNTGSDTTTVTKDATAPTVSSIVRAGSDPTKANSVSWTVTFSESVTGVDASDFSLASTGLSGASITGVSGNNATRTVTANTGSGNGTLGLNLVDDDTILDLAGNKLGGTGAGNGNKTGEVYTVSKNASPTDIGLTPSSVDENKPAGTTVGALSTTDPDNGDTHTYSLVSGTGSTDNASFTIDNSTGTLKTAASFDFENKSSYSVRVKSQDAGGLFVEKQFTITVTNVNEAPKADAQSVSTPEDTAKQVTLSGSDVEGDSLSYIIVSGPAHGTLTGTGANRTYTPAANYNGPDSFTFRANDGQADSNVATVSITVNAVNDAPSFTKGADQTVLQNSGAKTVTGWATSISAGPTDESGQALNFIVTNNNNSLFTATGQPKVAANSTLTYTLAANAIGTATVDVALHDDGGTANGGVDTSAPQAFKITVNYNWTGFFSPVDNPTSTSLNWNSAKAGQSIPMKFRLAGNQGLSVLDGAPRVTSVACPSTSTPVDATEEYAVTANNGLVYDATADQYNFVWKTQSTYANKCYKFDMVLADGTHHEAYFKFLK